MWGRQSKILIIYGSTDDRSKTEKETLKNYLKGQRENVKQRQDILVERDLNG